MHVCMDLGHILTFNFLSLKSQNWVQYKTLFINSVRYDDHEISPFHVGAKSSTMRDAKSYPVLLK